MKQVYTTLTLLIIITTSVFSQTSYYVNDLLGVDIPANNVYTSAPGSDANPGTAALPFATLTKAMTTAVAGDVIYVDAGTYPTINFTINKSITILGPNHNITPLDATRMEYNESRNEEAFINGSSIGIAANNVVIKGLVFDPGARIAISKGNNGLSFSNITIAKNGFIITSNQGAINIFGNNASPSASTNYTIEDNVFVQQGSSVVQSMTLQALDIVNITNNSFLNGDGGTRFTQTAIHLGASSLVSNITINDNVIDEPFTGIFSNFIGNITVDNNKFLGCFNATAIRDANVASNTITLKNNYYQINRSNDAFVVQLLGPTNVGTVKRVVVENNTVDINATGFPNSPTGYLYAQCNVGVVNAEYQGRKNVINITGNLTGYLGLFFTMRCNGKFNAVNIDSNEVYFNATNLSTSSNAYGIVVNLNTGGGNVPPPGSAINITHNKVSGFGRAVQFLGGSLPGVTCNINENSLINNRDLAIVNGNQISPAMNATCNWYGFTNAQSIAAKIFSSTPGAVNYTPWLINGTDNEPSTPGFQPLPGSCIGTVPVVTLDGSTNLTCFESNNGAINVSGSSGTGPYTFAWTKTNDPGFNSTSENPTGLSAGTYNLVMTDANGSTASLNNITITQPSLLTASADGTDASCYSGSNGSASVIAGGGTAPYTYLWSNNATTSSISNLAAGIYSVTVTDAHGCTAIAEYEVTEPQELTVTSIGTNVSCFGGSDGAVSLSVSGGTTPYTYLWSNNATTAEITNLLPGDYSVTVTDANGCTAQASYTVTQPTLLTAVATGTSTSCANSATVVPSGGTSPYNYLWSNGATTQSISSLPAGIYSVTVTDAKGCTTSASCTVSASEAFNPSASVTDVTCYGMSTGSITVTNVNGAAPFRFSLDGVNFGLPVSLPFTFSNLAAGTYAITVKDANGCTGFVTKTITQPTQLVATLNSVQSTCYGFSTGSVNVTVTGGSPAYTYHWAGPNGYTSTQLNINNLVAGAYTLTVTDNNGCTAVQQVVVPSYNQIIVNATITDITCKGLLNGSIVINVTGGTGNFSYLWNTGATTSSIYNLAKGNNYKLTVTDIGSGCIIQSSSYTINEPASAISITVPNQEIIDVTGCNSPGSLRAVGSGGTPFPGADPYLYSINGIDFQPSQVFSNLNANNYSVLVKDANGCTASRTIIINDNGSDEYEGSGSNKNNTKGKAVQIGLGTNIAARIASTGDPADWYKFTTISAGNYTMNLTHPSVAFVFNLYTASSTTALPTQPGSTSVNKIYTLNANTTYYISVTGGLSFICYQLSVTTGLPLKSSGSKPQNEIVSLITGKENFDIKAFPNPSGSYFNLKVETGSNEKMSMRVVDITGRVIEEKQNLQPQQMIRLGDRYVNGVYIAEIIQGENRKAIRLVKM